MNKKVIIYSVLMAILAIGASAMLVKYLSNTINAEVTVSTPMEIVFGETGTSQKVITAYGGDEIKYATLATNKANRGIEVYKVVHQATSDNNWQGNEFNSINLIDRGQDMGNILPYACHIKPDGSVIPFSQIGTENTKVAKLIFDSSCNPQKYTHPAQTTIDNNISIVLNPALAEGTYTMKICHLYDLTGNC